MAELKPGWQRWRFAQIAANINERVDNPSEAGVDRYVGLEHLDADSLKIRRWGSPDDVGATKLRFYPGDIIFGRRRAYQRKLGVADFEGICSAHAMVLRAKPDVILPEFLPFFMQSDLFMERALEISVGSLSPTINWKTLAAQEFALPPLEEQRRLARVLRALRDTIESYESAQYAANLLIQARREHLLSGENCRRMPLQEVLDGIEAGKSVLGYHEPPVNGAKGVLKVSAVGGQGFRPSEAKTLVNEREFLPQYTVRSGDLLISRANTYDLVGLVCLVTRDYPSLMLSDKTLRLVVKREYSARLIYEALMTAGVRSQIRTLATGTGAAMKNLSQQKIRNLEISLPTNFGDQSTVYQRILEVKVSVDYLRKRLEQCRRIMSKVLDEAI